MDRPRSWRSQGIDLSVEPCLRVGGAAIDPVSREAKFTGGHERLQPQNLKVLIALARRRGEVVTRADLNDLCWDGRIVGEDVINHSISVLRAFAERAGGFAIETVPKAGYRLTETQAAAGRLARWTVTLGWAVAAAVTIGLLFAIPAYKQGDPPVPTVALAPFGVPAGDPAAAEVGRAARVSLSHMLADGGFPVRLTDSRGAGSEFVISGDIMHGPGKIQAIVRMLETRHNTVVFTRQFEVPEKETATLPDQIGASVAANLSWTAALMILDRRRPIDPEITAELLRQLSLTVEGGDMLRAYEIALEIAPKVPDSAIAQLSLAFNTGFALGQLPREQRGAAAALGRRAAERALALAPEFGDSHIPWCVLHSPVRLRECEARLRQGMKADPDAPFTTGFLSALYSDAGRFEDALEMARMSIANDPYKPSKLGRIIAGLAVNGRAEDADEAYARAIRWWPDNDRVRWGRLFGWLMSGDLGSIERFANADLASPAALKELMTAWSSRDGAKSARLCSRRQHPFTEMTCMAVLADLGMADTAFAAADRMYPRKKGRDPREEEQLWLDNPDRYPLALISAPSTSSLRRDARFIELAERVGVLDYWRAGRPPDFCRAAREPVCASIVG